MVSGKKIRNRSLAITAVLSAILQNVLLDIVEDIFSQHASIIAIIGIFIYCFVFILLILLLRCLAKIRWIRVHIFKEKIVEGKWFECIYEDPKYIKPYSYGIVMTFYDDDGELIYKGDDYDLSREFNHTGNFWSTCTSLKYYTDRHENEAKLDYAYNFEYEGMKHQGYGDIRFTIGKARSNYHEGRFFNSDGKVYYFKALLITNKQIIKQLDSGNKRDFIIAMEKLVDIYNKDCSGSQTEKIKLMYENDPQAFQEFCTKEDAAGNIADVISKFTFKDKDVLDMGAGTGRFSKLVVKDVNSLVCSDLSSKMISYLKESKMAQRYGHKISFIHCDHMALPTLVSTQFDYIIAGYSIGAYFTDDLINHDQKKKLFHTILSMVESLLRENGTLIIVESLGIGQINNTTLFEFDQNLRLYFQLLEESGFEKTEVDTSFIFDTEEEANDTIYEFWGTEGVKKIQRENNKWILKEVSGVWVKTFNKL